jgi:hypothetical protein
MRRKGILRSTWITILLLITGTVWMGIGIWREEYTVVMEKAINICLECIGIG